MYIDKCVFVDGQHVYTGLYCPHDRTEDETGLVIEPGWTVQSTNPREVDHATRQAQR